MSIPGADFIMDIERGITVVTFSEPKIIDGELVDRLKNELYGLIDNGVDRLILDFKNVVFLNSEFLAVLVSLRRKLSSHKPLISPAVRKWELFEVCPDRGTALDVISSSDSEPIIFCSVALALQPLFKICSLDAEN